MKREFDFIFHPNDEEFFHDLVEFLYNHNKNFWDENITDHELIESLDIMASNIMEYIESVKIPLYEKEDE